MAAYTSIWQSKVASKNMAGDGSVLRAPLRVVLLAVAACILWLISRPLRQPAGFQPFHTFNGPEGARRLFLVWAPGNVAQGREQWNNSKLRLLSK